MLPLLTYVSSDMIIVLPLTYVRADMVIVFVLAYAKVNRNLASHAIVFPLTQVSWRLSHEIRHKNEAQCSGHVTSVFGQI